MRPSCTRNKPLICMKLAGFSPRARASTRINCHGCETLEALAGRCMQICWVQQSGWEREEEKDLITSDECLFQKVCTYTWLSMKLTATWYRLLGNTVRIKKRFLKIRHTEHIKGLLTSRNVQDSRKFYWVVKIKKYIMHQWGEDRLFWEMSNSTMTHTIFTLPFISWSLGSER